MDQVEQAEGTEAENPDGLRPYRVVTAVRWDGETRPRGSVLRLPPLDGERLMQVNRVEPAWVGPCTAETRRCDTTVSYHDRTPDCCREHLFELLEFTDGLLREAGIQYWADYGTLLGIVRHRNLIPWDKDADFGLLGEALPRVLELREKFEERGFAFVHRPLLRGGGRFGGGNEIKIRYSERNHTNLDLFFWYPLGEKLERKAYIEVDRFKGREFPAEWLFPLRERRFGTLSLMAPAKAKNLVTHRYPDWETPVRANHGGRFV